MALASAAGCDTQVGETAQPKLDATQPEADVSETTPDASEPDSTLADSADLQDGAALEDVDQQNDADADPEFAPPWNASTPPGGVRPALVFLPDDYQTTRRWPLVIMLHGYSSNAAGSNTYLGLEAHTTSHGYIGIAPEGLRDSVGNRFWNATDACCDNNDNGVDDVAYLTALIDEAEQRLAVDPERIYLIGHSNGGFMSYRLACELGSRIAALASLAGSEHDKASDCTAPGKTGVLQIHGTLDSVVLYGGGMFYGNRYPGAEDVVARWATRNGCEPSPTRLENIDVTSLILGKETEVERWSACDDDSSVELWRIRGGSHIPALTAHFTGNVLDFLFRHRGRR